MITAFFTAIPIAAATSLITLKLLTTNSGSEFKELNTKISVLIHQMDEYALERQDGMSSLDRIASSLEHLRIEQIDNIDHNHVEGDINNHPKTW
tara:strand:- start:9 stop:290 length:282 start_codon:yes stop_codon:yes gene_type:complete